MEAANFDGAHLVVWLNVELDLLPGECANSAQTSMKFLDRGVIVGQKYLINKESVRYEREIV